VTQQPPPGYPPYPPYGPPAEDVTLSVLAHLSLFAFSLIGPLVLYLIVKDDPTKPMTRHHAAEALNFHLSLMIYGIVSLVLILVIVGIFMLIALGIGAVVLAIIAAVAAGNRQPYRYPLTIRFVH
jgi:uncharacterized Tic20 family protein